MDCRNFRNNHVGYVDDTLSGIELVGMQRHLSECETCAAHDSNIRRSLLLFRNLPRIAPSPDFTMRLESRLRDESQLDVMAISSRNLRLGGFAVAVASAILMGYVVNSLPDAGPGRDIIMPPVIAMTPEVELPHGASAGAAMVASVSVGLPIWTAAFYAEQAPASFAKPEITLASYTR